MSRYLAPAGPIAGGAHKPDVLTPDRVPELAVFGWYSDAWPTISAQGLTRQHRFHTPLTRRSAGARLDLFIWCDVHRAMEHGVVFFKSRRCAPRRRRAHHARTTRAPR